MCQRHMRTSIFAFLIVVVLSCKDNDKGPLVCNTENPLELPWMKEKITAIKQGSHESESYIQQIDQNGVYYFYFNTCCATCDPPNWYYDCAGNQVTLAQEYVLTKTTVKIIWQGDNFKCVLM